MMIVLLNIANTAFAMAILIKVKVVLKILTVILTTVPKVSAQPSNKDLTHFLMVSSVHKIGTALPIIALRIIATEI